MNLPFRRASCGAKILHMPGSRDGNENKYAYGKGQSSKYGHAVFLCPNGILGGNGVNYFYQGQHYDVNAWGAHRLNTLESLYRNIQRFSRLKRPSAKCALFDGNRTTAPLVTGVWLSPEYRMREPAQCLETSNPAEKNAQWDFYYGRHKGLTNLLYYDGHAAAMPCAEAVNARKKYAGADLYLFSQDR